MGRREAMKAVRFFAVVSVAVLLAGCGAKSSPSSSTTTPKGPTTTVNHQASLAPKETPDLAAQLVTVPGYSYVDPPASEINTDIKIFQDALKKANLPTDFIAAASFHGVVAADSSQNRSHTASGGSEVGFLQLYAYSEPPPAGLANDEAFFTSQHDGKAPITHLQLSGIRVYVFEIPNEPDSRFNYSWLRHGILANFDGADRTSLERWLSAYLATPNPSTGETTQLAALLTPVEGFAYVNFTSPDITNLVTTTFGKVPYSAHQIVDDQGMVAGLVLMSSPTTKSTADAVAAFQKADPTSFISTTTTTIAGTTVDKFQTTDNGTSYTTYVWVKDGVVGSLNASDTAQAESFLNGKSTVGARYPRILRFARHASGDSFEEG
jgi:hypothetical protein